MKTINLSIKFSVLILFIVTTFSVISISANAQGYSETFLEYDTLEFNYEKPLIHLEYNRYIPSRAVVYQGINIPIKLWTERLCDGNLWMDVRIDFDKSDGVNYSNWYRSSQSASHNTSFTYQSSGTKVITIQLYFIDVVGRNKTITLNDTIIVIPQPTKVYSDDAGNKLYLWQSGSYDKPTLCLEGFDPHNNNSAADNYFLASSLMSDVAGSGYDVLICDWANGGAPIQDNAKYVEQMVEHAYNLLPDSVEACVQVIGLSMGGLIGRYGLAQMEGYSLDPVPRDVQHYTNTFISFDSPQQGAHINHQFQNFIHDDSRVPADYKNELSAPAARQMLYFDPYAFGNESANFYTNVVRNLNNQTPGLVNQNGGYPEICKKFAVSNGNLQPVYTDKVEGVTELGRLRFVFSLSGSLLFSPWVEVRNIQETTTFITEHEDYWPGSTFSKDIRSLNRYESIYPNISLPWWAQILTLGGFLARVDGGNANIDLKFNYNPSYQPTESSLDFKGYSFSRASNGAIIGGQSYFDGTLQQSVSRRHEELTQDSRSYIMNVLNTYRTYPYIVRPTNLAAASTHRTVTLSFQDNSVFEEGTLIERQEYPDTTWLPIVTLPNNPIKRKSIVYIDSSVLPNHQYTYRLRSFKGTKFSPNNIIAVNSLTSIAPDTITVATKWDDNVQIIKPLVITGNGNLSIQPGIRVSANANGSIIIKPGGKIQIAGTRTAPVVFTSSGTEKWKGISLSEFPQPPGGLSFPISLDYVVIENALIGFQSAAGRTLTAFQNYPNSLIDHSQIKNCDVGISGEGYCTISLKNSVVSNCTTGVALRNMNLPMSNGFFVNDTIRSCETGLYMWNTSFAKVINTVFEGLDGSCTGIALNAFSFLEAHSSKITGFKTAVVLADRNYLSLSCSEITNNTNGILLNGESASLTAKGCLIHDNTNVELQCVSAIPNLDNYENGFYDINGTGSNLTITKARFPLMARNNYWGGTIPKISSPVYVEVNPMLSTNPGLNCEINIQDDPNSKKGKYNKGVSLIAASKPDSAWNTFMSLYNSNEDSLESYWGFGGLITSGLAKSNRDINSMLSDIHNIPSPGSQFSSDRDYTTGIGAAFQGNIATALNAVVNQLTYATTSAESLGCNLVAKEIGYIPLWQFPNDSLQSDSSIVNAIWSTTKSAVIDINNLLNHPGGNGNTYPKTTAHTTSNYSLRLDQNFPNPFSAGSSGNPSTTISYSVPREQQITLSVFNTLGQTVKVLVNNIKSPGEYIAMFDASNIPSGMYYYRLKADDFSIDRKMIVLR